MKPVALAFSAVLVAALAGCTKETKTSASSGPAAVPVKVAVAESKTLPVEIRTIGNVEAFKTISVKSQVGGALIRVHFKEGDAVRKGQPLFDIDPRPYEGAIRQIEANLARDTALLKQAEANLARDSVQEKFSRDQAKRYNELAKQGVFSKEQSEQVLATADAQTAAINADRAAMESARSSMAADKSALDTAKVQLGYCSIVSPVDGRSGNINVKEGNLVKANDVELVTLMQIQPVYVTFTAPEKQLDAIRGRMRAGKLMVAATPQGAAPKPDEGALTFIDNAVDQNTGTIKLKGTFPNSSAKLWPGQFVDVVLTLSQKQNAVTVPSRAVQIGQGGNFVYIVKSDQTVEMRNVTIGDSSGGMAEVREGVQPGETVVTEGHVRLAPGSHVKVQS